MARATKQFFESFRMEITYAEGEENLGINNSVEDAVNQHIADANKASKNSKVNLEKAYDGILQFFDDFETAFKSATERIGYMTNQPLTLEELPAEAYICCVRMGKMASLLKDYSAHVDLILVDGKESKEVTYRKTCKALLQKLTPLFAKVTDVMKMMRVDQKFEVPFYMQSSIQIAKKCERDLAKFVGSMPLTRDEKIIANAQTLVALIEQGHNVENIDEIKDGNIFKSDLYKKLSARYILSDKNLDHDLLQYHVNIFCKGVYYLQILIVLVKYTMLLMHDLSWDKFNSMSDKEIHERFEAQKLLYMQSQRYVDFKNMIITHHHLNEGVLTYEKIYEFKKYIENWARNNHLVKTYLSKGSMDDAIGEIFSARTNEEDRVNLKNLHNLFNYIGFSEIANEFEKKVQILPQQQNISSPIPVPSNDFVNMLAAKVAELAPGHPIQINLVASNIDLNGNVDIDNAWGEYHEHHEKEGA